MRNLTCLLILLLIIASSCNSNPFNQYDENLIYINNLKGKIKSVKSETYRATEIFGEAVKEELATPLFDLSNTLANILSPNSTINFAENGKTTSFRDLSYSLKLTYDKEWNVLEEHFNADNNEIITKFKTVDNKIISSTSFDKELNDNRISEFLYEDDLIKEVITKNNEKRTVSKIKFDYEDKKQIQNYYNELGKLQRKNRKDIYGKYLEIEIPQKKRILVQYIDQSSFPSEMLRYEDNQIIGKLEITLDDHKNISEIKDIDIRGKDETLYKYTYKYDKHGNWIERIKHENGNLKYITERTIEYY